MSAPFNWCDRQCERCPLEPDCALARRERGTRWAHEQRGEDPDAPEVFWADMQRELELTERLIREAAEAEGVDLDAPLTPEPRSLLAERLARSGTDCSVALHALLRQLDANVPSRSQSASTLQNARSLFGMKAARVASHLSPDGSTGASPFAAEDCHANLLLLEYLLPQVTEALNALGLPPDRRKTVPTVAEALDGLSALLRPLLADIPAQAREELRNLVASGVAPSPFCVR